MLVAWGGEGRDERGEMGAVRQGRRVQETSLRAQETLWWNLKCKCCDVSVGLSSKTVTYPGAITPSSTTLASRRPCECSVSVFFVLFCFDF